MSAKVASRLRSPINATRLPPLPSIRELVKLYRLRAIKQLSQNFLLDEKLTNKIVKAAGNIEGRYVCEVGPGPGGITRSILHKGAKKVILIEKDLRFKSLLGMLTEACPGRIETYWGDVLSFNLSKSFPEEVKTPWEDDYLPPVHIIGNLPFSIATPLIVKWLRCISERSNAWEYGRVPLTLTFQKEVADRIVAEVMDGERCRLSVMCQYLTAPKHKFSISGNAFIPKPDVDVGVVKFVPRKVPLISQPFPLVEKVTRQIFSRKPRYAWKGASSLFPAVLRKQLIRELYRISDVNPEIRPVGLTVEEIGSICNAYAKICEEYPVRDYNFRGHKPDEEWESMYGHIYGYMFAVKARLKAANKGQGTTTPFDYDEDDLELELQEDKNTSPVDDEDLVMGDLASSMDLDCQPTFNNSNHNNNKLVV